MLPKRIRLPRQALKTVLRSGRSQTFPWGTLRFLPRPSSAGALPPPRFAVVVPVSAVKKAVTRNLLKRRLRAIIFRQTASVVRPVDAVLFFKNGEALNLKFKELSAVIEDSFRKARILL